MGEFVLIIILGTLAGLLAFITMIVRLLDGRGKR